jgi:glycosyltransferase involved in cell wall biosynthesis
MRVCIVTVASYAHGIGGMQAHALDLGRGLVRAGHEVEVIASRHPEGLEQTEHEGIRWHFVDAPSRRRHMPMRHPAWLRLSSEAFVQLHNARPFDVVHSESTSALGLLRRNIHRRVPVVAKFHGNFLGLTRQAMRRAREDPTPRSIIRESKYVAWVAGAHFLTPGNFYRFRACEAMVPSRQQFEDTRRSMLLERARMHVVPNGIDVDEYTPQEQDGARTTIGLNGGPLLVTVGRLNREKGVDHAIRSLQQLPEAQLAVVGSGEELGELQRLVRELGLEGRVTFAGRQPPDVVKLYLAAADVFLFPTIRDEAAPIVLLEAMASARPVIASCLGGIPEVIDHPGENGILVQPGAPAAIASAVRSLLADENMRAAIGRGARARIHAEYSLERMIERTIAVYRRASERLG